MLDWGQLGCAACWWCDIACQVGGPHHLVSVLFSKSWCIWFKARDLSMCVWHTLCKWIMTVCWCHLRNNDVCHSVQCILSISFLWNKACNGSDEKVVHRKNNNKGIIYRFYWENISPKHKSYSIFKEKSTECEVFHMSLFCKSRNCCVIRNVFGCKLRK